MTISDGPLRSLPILLSPRSGFGAPLVGTDLKSPHLWLLLVTQLLRRWRVGGLKFKVTLGKKVPRPHFNQCLGTVVCISVILSFAEEHK
jgi:hypothetical protein